MKKVFALLLMLAMTMMCAGAMAVTITGYQLVGGVFGTGWSWDDMGKVLKITGAGTYTVNNWGSSSALQKGRIEITAENGDVTLTLDNVHLHYENGAVVHSYLESGNIVVNVNNSTLYNTAGEDSNDTHCIHISRDNSDVNVTVVNSKITNTDSINGSLESCGIFVYSDKQMTVTVEDSSEVVGAAHGIRAGGENCCGNADVTVQDEATVEGTGGSFDIEINTDGEKAILKYKESSWKEFSEFSIVGSGGGSVNGADLPSDLYAASQRWKWNYENQTLTNDWFSVTVSDFTGTIDVNPASGKIESLTLGEGVTAELKNLNALESLMIAGSENVPLNVEAGKDKTQMQPLADSPFKAVTDVLDSVKAFANAQNSVVIITEVDRELSEPGVAAPDAPADLPKTGDSSSLALWLALLAFAGAGMMARRKMEA